jgi:predicted permease
MNGIRWLMLRLRALVGRRALERDMQEEMREHLERAAERLVARGMSPANARAAARREFGNLTLIQEQARDSRGARWVDALIADVRFALRYFARKPLTAATTIAVLALGIGANSAIFTVFDAEVRRPAPAVPDDKSHARIYGLQQTTRGGRWQLRDFSYPELTQLAERRETFADVAGWTTQDVVLDLADSSVTREVTAEFVTPNFFSTLGVRLVAGPGLPSHVPTTPDAAAVISFAVAKELFESPADAIGRQILANDVALRVAGVAPPRFQGAIPNSRRPSIWMPLSMRAEVVRSSPRWLTDSTHLSVFARLAPNVKAEDASAIAGNVVGRMLPDTLARVGAVRSADVTGLRSPPPAHVMEPGDVDDIVVLGLIGLLILAVACTNVSALVVAAAVGRRHEIAVRLAQGATRGRLIRQLLTESSLLAITGGALGLLLYWWLIRLIASNANTDLTPDVTSLTFTMLFALGTGLVFGLAPAMHATRASAASALRDSGGGTVSRSRLQRAFVIAQIVCSQPLLVMLGLGLSYASWSRAPLPSDVAEHVITAWFRPAAVSDTPQWRVLVDSLRMRVAAHPGVASVVPEMAPIDFRSVRRISTGATDADPVRVLLTGAYPGYFDLLGARIVLGRDVSLADTTGSDRSVVVGNDVARRLWGDANPIGQRLASVERRDGKTDSLSFVVVGVVDVTHPAIVSPALDTEGQQSMKLYTAHGQRWHTAALVLRARGPAQPFLSELHTFFRSEAPSLSVNRLQTLAMTHDQQQREARSMATAALGAAAVALLLASLGLYGVVSWAVGQRMREIGIRIAVGAMPRRVARMFFASGVRLSATALLIGLPVCLVALRLGLSQGILIAPKANVWLIGAGTAGVMMLVASAASWWPARRAVRVDPVATLRVD